MSEVDKDQPMCQWEP